MATLSLIKYILENSEVNQYIDENSRAIDESLPLVAKKVNKIKQYINNNVDKFIGENDEQTFYNIKDYVAVSVRDEIDKISEVVFSPYYDLRTKIDKARDLF